MRKLPVVRAREALALAREAGTEQSVRASADIKRAKQRPDDAVRAMLNIDSDLLPASTPPTKAPKKVARIQTAPSKFKALPLVTKEGNDWSNITSNTKKRRREEQDEERRPLPKQKAAPPPTTITAATRVADEVTHECEASDELEIFYATQIASQVPALIDDVEEEEDFCNSGASPALLPEDWYEPRRKYAEMDAEDPTVDKVEIKWSTSLGKRLATALHAKTGTEALDKYTEDGVKSFTRATHNTLLADLAGDSINLDVRIRGLVLYIWLLVFFRAHKNAQTSRQSPVWDMCGTLRRAGLSIAAGAGDGYGTCAKEDLEDLLRYWNQRLELAYGSRRSRTVRWYEIDWWVAVPHVENLFGKQDDDTAGSYLRYYKEGRLNALIEKVRKEEMGSGTPLKLMIAEFPQPTQQALWEVLASMEPQTFEAGLRGAWTSYTNSDWDHPVTEETTLLDSRWKSAPGIYANFLTDRSGVPLTPHQIQPLLEEMQRYIKKNPTNIDNQRAAEIDCHPDFERRSWPSTFSIQKGRRYRDLTSRTIGKDKVCPTKNVSRQEIMGRFLKYAEQEMTGLIQAGHGDRPCPRALVEIGYGKKPGKRLEAHARHINSNYLMNFLDTARLLHYGQDFYFAQHILYSCWATSQSWLAEIILTRVFQGYIHSGYGLSHHPAGLSCGSSWKTVGPSGYDQVIKTGNVMERTRKALDKERQRLESLRTSQAEKMTDQARMSRLHPPLARSDQRGSDILQFLGSVRSTKEAIEYGGAK